MKCYTDGCENKNCVYLVLAERFIANQKLKVIENAQIKNPKIHNVNRKIEKQIYDCPTIVCASGRGETQAP